MPYFMAFEISGGFGKLGWGMENLYSP